MCPPHSIFWCVFGFYINISKMKRKKNKNLFFLQRRVTQSPWDRRSTTNFERWRIQCLPRFVNSRTLKDGGYNPFQRSSIGTFLSHWLSCVLQFPGWHGPPWPDTYCSICHSTLWPVEMATLKMAVFFVSVHLTPLFFPHLHGYETQAARRGRRT